jgi:hypothetical protein
MTETSFIVPLNTAMETTIYLSGSEIHYKYGFKKMTTSLQSLKEVILKSSKLNGTRIVKINYDNGKKVKQFLRLEGDPSNQGITALLEMLKTEVPHLKWTDEGTAKAVTKEGGKSIYDLQVYLVGYAGAGLPRMLQIWIIWGIFSLLIIPLPFFIYILMKKGYRIETDNDFITVRNIREKQYRWSEVHQVNMVNVSVKMYNEGIYTQTVQVIRFEMKLSTGKTVKFRMRTLEAQPFIKELVTRKKLAEEYVQTAAVFDI